MNKAQSIVGDSNHRADHDYYPTPDYATQALLDKEQFSHQIWEPACGEGHMSKVLIKNGYNVISSDLIRRGYGTPEIDFLTSEQSYDNIITNPPFSLGLEFILRAKKLSNHKIAMLLKTQFLEGVRRQPMFLDTEFPLKCMYQFSKRLTFGNKKSGGMLSFAWFVWQKDYVGKPYIDWI